MNYENFTIKVQEALQESSSIANKNDNAEISPEHLLQALLERAALEVLLRGLRELDVLNVCARRSANNSSRYMVLGYNVKNLLNTIIKMALTNLGIG